MVDVEIVTIGSVRTRYRDCRSTPVQTALNPDEHGRVELDPPYGAGLVGLEGFDYAWLLCWLTPNPDDPEPTPMQQVPFLLSAERQSVGLFAMRGPRRPNPIGLHLVRVLKVDEHGFDFAGVDMVDGTPLLDVKPWVAPLDLPAGVSPSHGLRSGWFDSVDLSAPHTPDSLGARQVDST